MLIEADGAFAFAQRLAVDSAQRSADRFKSTGRHVTGNDRVRDTGKTTMPEVDVGPAHFRSHRPQQRGALDQIGTRVFANLDRFVRPGHDGGEDAVAHGVR